MRIIIKLSVAVAVIAAGVYITGSLLPEEHTVIRSTVLDQSRGTVWNLITDNEKMKDWMPETKEVKELPKSKDGNEMWRFEDKSGHYMVVENTVTKAQAQLTSHIVETDYPFGGDWIFTLEDAGKDKTKLTLTEKGKIYNPFCRFLSHFIMGYDQGVEKFLEAVAKKFNETPDITIE